MFRRLFTVLSALSLLLCVAVCVLWVRSERTNDEWSKVHRARRVQVKSDAGIVGVEVWDGPFSVAGMGEGEDAELPPEGVWVHQAFRRVIPQGGMRFASQPHVQGVRWWNRLGFSAGDEPATMTVDVGGGPEPIWSGRFRWLTLPYWLPAVVSLPLVLVGLRTASRQIRRRLRTRIGACPRCGYDLRATPGRCPECGALPAAQQA
jgi:hypothetical protein